MLEIAGHFAAMDTIRRNLLDAADRAGISLTALSKLAGMNDAYAQQFVNRGTPKRLPEDVRLCWAKALRIDEQELGARPPWSPHFTLSCRFSVDGYAMNT